MRSLLASLALALAPLVLTHTQTLAPRLPHALPGSHGPASPRSLQHRRAPRVPSPSAPHSLRAPLAHRRAGFAPLGAHRSAPVSPTLLSQSGNRFFLLTAHGVPPLFFLPSQRDLLWGWAPPESLWVLFRRLCSSAALGRKLAPGPGPHPGSGAQGVSASPGPRPPAAFLQARGEDRLPPFPAAVAFLSASPSSATRLRAGDSGPRCSRDFSAANSPGIWRGRGRDAGGEGAQGGRGREKAVKGSPRQV